MKMIKHKEILSPGEWMGRVSQHDPSLEAAWLSSLSRAWGPTQPNFSNLPKHQRVSHPWHSPAASCHGVPSECGEGVSMESRTVEKEEGVRRKQKEAIPSGPEKSIRPPAPSSQVGHVPANHLPFLPQRLD